MNTTLKNYLGGAIILALLVVMASVWSFAATYSRAVRPYGYPTFSVSGEGKVVAVPDVAQFTFSVITEGDTKLGDLQTYNTERMNKAIAAVKAKGVVDKDIKTESYTVSPRYRTFACNNPILYSDPQPCPPSDIVGYTVTQMASVKVRNFAVLGDTVAAVTESGANQVYGVNFTIDDPTAAQNMARAEAVKEAREKADAIAKAAGFRVGRIISINEGGYYPYDTVYGRGGVTGVAVPEKAPIAPMIEPGSQDVIVSVSVTYEMK